MTTNPNLPYERQPASIREQRALNAIKALSSIKGATRATAQISLSLIAWICGNESVSYLHASELREMLDHGRKHLSAKAIAETKKYLLEIGG